MIILWIFVFLHAISLAVPDRKRGVTPYEELKHIEDMSNEGVFQDAEHRGPQWYDQKSSQTEESETDSHHKDTESTSTSSEDSISPSQSSEASSFETNERRLATQVHRSCTPCPHDMLKKRTNTGIKWICGAYQRARRSFKSVCMMRYRNCQDGTLFVKLHDLKCRNDSFHGKHWFYVYRV